MKGVPASTSMYVIFRGTKNAIDSQLDPLKGIKKESTKPEVQNLPVTTSPESVAIATPDTVAE